MNYSLAWIVSGLTIALILIRPWKIPEAVWAVAGAVSLLLTQTISPQNALAAMGRGTDVYLFLTGMMLLSELARREGVFDWIAILAVRKARGSRTRLFAIVYGVGVIVTAFLSNDATAVVLTPAVLAVVKKAKAAPLPYLLVCAFIANAASFVLPISNPANLVIYGSHMPPLLTWLRTFAFPSTVSILATCFLLWLLTRKYLKGDMESQVHQVLLTQAGRRSAYGIVGTALVLLGASSFNLDLGLPTFLAAAAVTVFVSIKDRDAPLGVVKEISWSVIPLVAGLFVLVEAINGAGALALTGAALKWCASLPRLHSLFAAAFGVATLSNLMNNLPVGLIAGSVISKAVAPAIRDALLIGIDLGPNLSVTGSLATILWLLALRREGENISAWKFLGFGAVVMPIALAASIGALALTVR